MTDTAAFVAHLRSAHKRVPEGRVYAFGADESTDVAAYPDELRVDGVDWRVEWAPSELALRELLVDSKDDASSLRIAALTPMRDDELMADVRGRLAGGRVWSFDPWEALATTFEVSSVAPELRRSGGGRALARELLGELGGGTPPSVASTMLGPDVAWELFRKHVLGCAGEAEELADWLIWAADDPGGVRRLVEEIDESILEALVDRLERRHGPEARLAVELWREGCREGGAEAGVRALASGMVADAVAGTVDAEPDAGWTNRVWGAFRATLAGGDAAHAEAIERFGREARRALERGALDDDLLATIGSRVDARLDSIADADHVRDLAVRTPVGESSLEVRRERFAEALDAARQWAELETSHDREGLSDQLEALESTLREVEAHASTPKEAETLRAAARLAGWLTTREVTGAPEEGHVERARHYASVRSVADRLRERLRLAECEPPVGEAVDRLVDRADRIAETRNEAFARELAADLERAERPTGAVAPQDWLKRVVAPIAEDRSVLVVMLDGTSWAIARRLLVDAPLAEDWHTWAPADEGRLRPMYAAIPSETGYSRTSMWTGRLQSGQQHDERREFGRALAELEAIGHPDGATLFHKGTLDADGPGDVGADVRQALGPEGPQVVGVVLNAVDDALSGSDQHVFEWSVDALAPLGTLLRLARERTVVLASDHGHVRDGREHRPGGAGAQRWRPADRAPEEGELRLESPMVEALTGESAIVVPWSERIRYTGPARGYHGGTSMPEVVAPTVVLTRGDGLEAEGFAPLSDAEPAWWRLDPPPVSADLGGDAVEGGNEASEPTDASDEQVDWLDSSESGDERADEATWIEALLATERFQSRRERHASDVPPSEFARLLMHLRANGDQLSLGDVARLFDRGTRETKVRLEPIRSTLNVEGYQALAYDRFDQRLSLDPTLLKRQFEVD